MNKTGKPADNQPTLTPGVYKHFKGNTYHVLGVAIHAHTGELFAQYIPQYGPFGGQLAHRPLAMFLEHVDRPSENYSGPRFALVESKNLLAEQKFRESSDGKYKVFGVSENTESHELVLVYMPNEGRRKGWTLHAPLRFE